MESLMRGNKLYSASINGDINLLKQLLEEDRFVLEDYGSSVGFCLNGTPLHIAATRGYVEFAKVLLHHKSQLVCELDSRSRTPLHLAVANGRVEVVRLLLEQAKLENNDICLMTDEFGRTPLHLASAKGRVEMVKVLLENPDKSVCLLTDEFGRTPLRLAVVMNAGPQVVKELAISEPKAIADLLSSTKTVRILHSYILRNGVKALEIFTSVGASASADSFLCSQDEEGNTILHRVVSLRKMEMLEYLIPENQNDRYLVAVDFTNRNNLTVLDLIDQMPKNPKIKSIHNHITMHTSVDTENKIYVDKRKNGMMVVATLIAGMAYQAGLSPPGGVWDNDNDYATAGTSIMSLKEPRNYDLFWTFNTTSFVGALTIVLLLMHGSPYKSYGSRFRGYARRFYMGFLTFIVYGTATSMIVAYIFASIGITEGDSWNHIFGIVRLAGVAWFGMILIISFIRGCDYFIYSTKKMVHFSMQIPFRNVNKHKRPQGNDNGTTGKCCGFV